MSRWVPVADENEIPRGGWKLVQLDDIDLALFNVDDQISCIEDLCTHDGGNLVEGDFEGRVVTCPRHGAKFDVITGEALCLPAVIGTPVHAVRIRDGRVEVEIDE
ncbi:MAG TPA: non-heme iron oxygenase ferredoxin subunit [Candidatus Eisenbacteria bacterium]|nr:non-heme iron oxygenase ferredoxin subunit [Candidatus Eisenbacteria bacterium]